MKFTPNRLPAEPTPPPNPGCVDCGRDLLTARGGVRLAEDGTVRSGNGSPITRCTACSIHEMKREWVAGTCPHGDWSRDCPKCP